MDDALALRVKRRSRFQKQVLILVVMDDALAQSQESLFQRFEGSLNPCCNG